MMKTCSGCKEEKALDGFNKSKRDGHTSRCKTYRQAYYTANREQVAAYQREYRAANREQINANGRDYRQARPEVVWVGNYRHRAKAYGFVPLVESFTHADVIDIYGDACVHCGGPFEELDHYPVPVALGGPHKLANVRPSCAPCNGAQSGDIKAARRTNQNTTEILEIVVQGLQKYGSPIG